MYKIYKKDQQKKEIVSHYDALPPLLEIIITKNSLRIARHEETTELQVSIQNFALISKNIEIQYYQTNNIGDVNDTQGPNLTFANDSVRIIFTSSNNSYLLPQLKQLTISINQIVTTFTSASLVYDDVSHLFISNGRFVSINQFIRDVYNMMSIVF